MSYKEIVSQFTESYYSHFDSNRAGLATFYRDSSVLSFEGDEFRGAPSIVSKLAGLPFSSVRHSIRTVASLDMDPDILVLVAGQLQVDGDNGQNFSQAFYLKRDGSHYFVERDIFHFVLF
ncbi:Nuclear transport factor 2 [Mortierella alpina]|nr:Nuclear transport factor 2 [Mortierella alpina]